LHVRGPVLASPRKNCDFERKANHAADVSRKPLKREEVHFKGRQSADGCRGIGRVLAIRRNIAPWYPSPHMDVASA
jgi:hypothetical protein